MSLEESDKAAAAVQKTPNRVTLELLKSRVAFQEYVTLKEAVKGKDLILPAGQQGDQINEALGVTTLCIVVTTNGFTFVGKSAPADPGGLSMLNLARSSHTRTC